MSRYQLVFDMKDFSFDNIDLLTLYSLQNQLGAVYLNRISKIFILNTGPLFQTMYMLAEKMMSNNVRSRLRNLDKDQRTYAQFLQQYYDIEEIPADYGGKGPLLPQPD